MFSGHTSSPSLYATGAYGDGGGDNNDGLPPSGGYDPSSMVMLGGSGGGELNMNNNIDIGRPSSYEPYGAPNHNGLNANGNGGASASYYMGTLNLFLKLLFYTCIICQVILWPSVMTITLAGALALEGLLVLFFSGGAAATRGLSEYSVLLLHGAKVTPTKYVAMGLLAVYSLCFFMLYAAHESRSMPLQTTWIHPTLYGAYRFTDKNNLPFEGVGVTDSVARTMRDWTYEWPRSLQAPAIGINHTIPMQGPSKGALRCGGFNESFACYSAKLAVVTPPTDVPSHKRYVPFPGQFYTADAIITPPPGMPCSTVEVYRLNLDPDGNVLHGLDYPASAIVPTPNANGAPYSKCNLFGWGTAWCLPFLHAFSEVDYTSQVMSKCALSENQQLTIRLPSRAEDVNPSTGRMGHDLLVVTAGARVQMRWRWHDLGEKPSLLSAWEQTSASLNDQTQTWRDASDTTSVFFKYAIAITPLLLLWYYLAVCFREIVKHYQVLMMCIYVLLPAVLFFLSVGAWLPMVGAIVCTLAINHTPATHTTPGAWMPSVRHSMLFLTAICNSVQFVWLWVLVGQAGWSAFLYETSLKQLATLSSQFIVSGDPQWLGLVLPVELLFNLAFLLGAAICVAMELIAAYNHRLTSPPPSTYL